MTGLANGFLDEFPREDTGEYRGYHAPQREGNPGSKGYGAARTIRTPGVSQGITDYIWTLEASGTYDDEDEGTEENARSQLHRRQSPDTLGRRDRADSRKRTPERRRPLGLQISNWLIVALTAVLIGRLAFYLMGLYFGAYH
jgi:hypothetical protein